MWCSIQNSIRTSTSVVEYYLKWKNLYNLWSTTSYIKNVALLSKTRVIYSHYSFEFGKKHRSQKKTLQLKKTVEEYILKIPLPTQHVTFPETWRKSEYNSAINPKSGRWITLKRKETNVGLKYANCSSS